MTLYQRLNMSPEEQGITPETTIVELGVDSLLAVDMRTWFTKELDLDMPVLKILGGATVSDLVEDAVKRLSPDLIPNVVKAAPTDTAVDEKSEQPATASASAEADQSFRDTSEATKVTDTKANLGPGDSPASTEDRVDDSSNHSDAGSWVAVQALAVSDGPESEGETPDEAAAAEEEEEQAAQETAMQDLPREEQKAEAAEATAVEGVAERPLLSPLEEITRSESPASSRDGSNSGAETPETHLSDDESEDAKPQAETMATIKDTQASMIDSEPIKASDEAEEVKVEIPETKLVFSRTTKMSYASSRFWFLMRYLEDPTTFNLTCRLQFTGHIREHDAERAIANLGRRHEAFRTAFFSDPDRLNEPTQGVLAEKDSPLRLEKRRITSDDEVDMETEELMKYIFRLDRGESIRIKLLSISETTHYLIFGFHHIAIDGFSFNILLSEINKMYDGEELSPVTCQFSDFAERQRQAVEEGRMDGEMQFWRGEYPDFPEPLPLFPVAHGSKRREFGAHPYVLSIMRPITNSNCGREPNKLQLRASRLRT
jgi:hybrid polyketide synthase / nonribosomal peptide synthetase ACE1